MELIFIIISIFIVWVASLWKIFFSHSKPTFLNESTPLHKKNVLLVVAHPDDESMFFSPTINYLTSKGHNLYLPLVLGHGKVNPRFVSLLRFFHCFCLGF
ncbi:hypothetical protein ES332_D05G031600v1 [Gossypium tomentosum]|uniref:N-acetylglucosaminylphosphatidylinositol deacetylase n=1 Tax=Gossypium tomentosum TaxID=34277 RepID=A0A5D2KQH8_GOSTO|nr:hypothetical protein ES332_D05G031600v1 [Gossypium tomentosum]